MRLTLTEIAAATGSQTTLTGEVSGFSIDSRTVSRGDLFIALRGENHDGHAFVGDTLRAGAAAAIVHEESGSDPRLLRVEDTLKALQDLAHYAWQRWGRDVVAVTGSAGKTTTKDAIAGILSPAMPVGRTEGNLNNHIGLPLSMLRVPDEAQVAVLEIGMNHRGEIGTLTRIVPPKVAVVTNVGYAHIENFENGIEGIASAKSELVEGLLPGGIAVLNYDDERVRAFGEAHPGRTVYYGFSPEAEVRAEDVELREDGVTFRVGRTIFNSALTGRHMVRNILAGIAVARVYGIDEQRLQEPVRKLQSGKMRGQRTERDGILIIDDCYNSNPDAAKSMIDVLRDVPARRRIAVLGEMLELGRWSEPLHRDVGNYVARCGITVLVGIRGVAEALVQGAVDAGLQKDAAYFFSDPCEAGAWLKTFAQPGDAILFKGSRGTRVEKALGRFLE